MLTVSTAFNFTSTGQGSYSFAAKNQFFYVDPETNSPVEFFADHPQAHTAAISGKLAVARPTVSKRATYTGTCFRAPVRRLDINTYHQAARAPSNRSSFLLPPPLNRTLPLHTSTRRRTRHLPPVSRPGSAHTPAPTTVPSSPTTPT